jgi:predicted N-acyltransferase
MAESLKEVVRRLGVSSAHITFVPEDEIGVLETAGYLHRTDQQFHFINEGYANHDDSSKRWPRASARRCARSGAALENGISIDWLTGSDLTEDIWDQFFAFYMDTGSRKWGRPYLTRKFYSLIGERMPDDILLVMARHNGRYVAGAINFIGWRYALRPPLGLHRGSPVPAFRGLLPSGDRFRAGQGPEAVEAGAQGEHKLARGYLPVTTHSPTMSPMPACAGRSATISSASATTSNT